MGAALIKIKIPMKNIDKKNRFVNPFPINPDFLPSIKIQLIFLI